MLSSLKRNLTVLSLPKPNIFSYGLTREGVDEETYRELYMLNMAIIVAFFVSVSLSVFYQWVSPTLVWLHVASTFFSLALFVVNIQFQNPTLSGRLGCVFFFGLLFVSQSILGGIHSSHLGWLILIPLAAGLTIGPKDAAFWSLVSVFAIVVLYLFDFYQIYQAPALDIANYAFTNMVLNAVLLLVLGVFVVTGVNRYRILETELAASVKKQKDEALIAKILSDTASTANEETNFAHAGKECLRILCKAQDWQAGRLWDVKSADLLATSIWHFENPNLMQLKLSAIGTSIDEKALARRAVQTDFAVLISDAPGEREQWEGSFCQALGMRSQFAWPIFSDGKVVAVIELFSEHLIEYDRRTDNLVGHVAAQLSHVRARELSREKIEQMAYLDHVSGLPNRYAYERAFSGILGRARRSVRPVHVLFLELTNAKRIIDVFGHAASDQYLRYTAQTLVNLSQGELQSAFGIDRTERVVARLSGDQFAMVFTGLSDEHPIEDVLRYVTDKIKSSPQIVQSEINVEIVVGVAQYPRDGASAAALNNAAAAALLEAKESVTATKEV